MVVVASYHVCSFAGALVNTNSTVLIRNDTECASGLKDTLWHDTEEPNLPVAWHAVDQCRMEHGMARIALKAWRDPCLLKASAACHGMIRSHP